MEIRYDAEVDILLVRLSEDHFDHAEETDGVIAHFSADGKPVLLEIQGAREFIFGSITSLVKGQKVRLS